jgi:hypothetical protein
MMHQRVATRWHARQANGVTADYNYAHGYATLHGDGDIQDVIDALKQSVMRRIPAPNNVPKIRGALKAFSFHWSNAQNAWDVIAVRDFPWGIDGAEFILFVGSDALSPLGKVWTLTEMKYVAKGLPRHPNAPSATSWGLRSANRGVQ